MTFGAPFFLIGLAALAVPIIIHLWSKNTRSTIAFGTLRFLKETETRTMRSIMPSQWLLLFLRLLILVLIVLILSEPRIWTEKSDRVETRYLIDPAYAGHAILEQLRDTLANTNQIKWLASGFPDYEKEVPVNLSSYWTLLSQSPEWTADQTIVISPLKASDFWGAEKPFPVPYQFVQLPTDPETKEVIRFVQKGQGYQLKAIYSNDKTSYEKIAISDAEPLVITYAIKTSQEYDEYGTISRSAIATLNELSPVSLKEVAVENADWLLWFTKDSIPDRTNMITLDPLQVQPWEELASNRVTLSNNWTKEMAVREQFPMRLLTLLAGEVPMDRNEMLAMNPDIFSYQLIEKNQNAKVWKDPSNWIWLLLLLTLLLERYLAFKSDRK
ncbi:MAG: BatA domain-containing protein [Cyclobacteriaceae bacterium]